MLRKEMAFLLIAATLMAIIDVLFYSCVEGKFVKSFLILNANVVMAMLMTLLLVGADFLKIKQPLKIALELLVSSYCCLLSFCWMMFGAPLDKTMIPLITGTNNTEVSEFFHHYITLQHIGGLLLASVLVFVSFAYITFYRCWIPSRKAMTIISVYLLVAFSGVGFSFYTLPGRIEGILRTERKNLADYLQHPQMIETSKGHPEVIMIIIGESFVKGHSSLYGYNKSTNPRLSQQMESGNLTAFRQASAPATHTADAFKYFMTTYSHSVANDDWYTYLTLPEILKSSGYHTIWFSNQAQTGWYDNISASFASICDSLCYTSVKGKGEQASDPDGVLLNPINEYIRRQQPSPNNRMAIFVHLMGQHVDFEQRYPADFARFQEKDYQDCQAAQRKNYATYDNATLYNDFVVDSLFTLLKDYDAVSLYFSDHGIDFYNSSDDYCSHAKDSDPISVKAALQIPFVVNTTEKFQTLHPQVVKLVEHRATRSFNTEDLPSLVMQITNFQIKTE